MLRAKTFGADTFTRCFNELMHNAHLCNELTQVITNFVNATNEIVKK